MATAEELRELLGEGKAGRYTRERDSLGRGTYSTVHRGVDTRTQQPVAIKKARAPRGTKNLVLQKCFWHSTKGQRHVVQSSPAPTAFSAGVVGCPSVLG